MFFSFLTGICSVDLVASLLQRLSQAPPGSRDSHLFVSMIRTLFYECRYFPKYPPHELALTAELFGQLIHRHVFISSGNSLTIALRCVLEAIRKGPSSKMFLFGIAALEQFLGRLFLFPQFLVALASLPELQSQYPSYAQYAQSVLRLIPEKFHNLVVLDPHSASALPAVMPDPPPIIGVASASSRVGGASSGGTTAAQPQSLPGNGEPQNGGQKRGRASSWGSAFSRVWVRGRFSSTCLSWCLVLPVDSFPLLAGDGEKQMQKGPFLYPVAFSVFHHYCSYR